MNVISVTGQRQAWIVGSYGSTLTLIISIFCSRKENETVFGNRVFVFLNCVFVLCVGYVLFMFSLCVDVVVVDVVMVK